jgi:hypothetical protein
MIMLMVKLKSKKETRRSAEAAGPTVTLLTLLVVFKSPRLPARGKGLGALSSQGSSVELYCNLIMYTVRLSHVTAGGT